MYTPHKLPQGWHPGIHSGKKRRSAGCPLSPGTPLGIPLRQRRELPALGFRPGYYNLNHDMYLAYKRKNRYPVQHFLSLLPRLFPLLGVGVHHPPRVSVTLTRYNWHGSIRRNYVIQQVE